MGLRFKPNVKIHVYRPGVPNYDTGKDEEILIEPFIRARRTLRSDSVVDADGVIGQIDGTVIVDETSKVREGDIIVFRDDIAFRFRVVSVDRPVLVSGRSRRRVLTIARERNRRSTFPGEFGGGPGQGQGFAGPDRIL